LFLGCYNPQDKKVVRCRAGRPQWRSCAQVGAQAHELHRKPFGWEWVPPFVPEDRDRHPVCTRGLKKVYITTRCASQTKQAGFRTGRCKKTTTTHIRPSIRSRSPFFFSKSAERKKAIGAGGQLLGHYLAPHAEIIW